MKVIWEGIRWRLGARGRAKEHGNDAALQIAIKSKVLKSFARPDHSTKYSVSSYQSYPWFFRVEQSLRDRGWLPLLVLVCSLSLFT
jgi:hypothetical protein